MDYKFIDDMTPDEFVCWHNRHSHKWQTHYCAYLYTSVDEGKKLEMAYRGSWVDVKDESNLYGICGRIKPQPKPKVYEPYEKVDPKWIGKLVKYKYWNTVRHISAISMDSLESVEVNGNLNSLRYMFEYYEWYNIETGETSPFGEEK